jgi:hypothetical protein
LLGRTVELEVLGLGPAGYRPLPPYLSQGGCYTAGMKIMVEKEVGKAEVIATFGEACLVQVGDRIELRDGSMADRTEALEWMSLFMPDEVVRLRK